MPMHVKVFESENMAGALNEVKQVLGPDALILSTRTVRKKGLGAFGKPLVQVTAAVDPDYPGPLGEEVSHIRPASRIEGAKASGASKPVRTAPPVEDRRAAEAEREWPCGEGGKEEAVLLKKELAEIKRMLRSMEGGGASRGISPFGAEKNVSAHENPADPLVPRLQGLGLGRRPAETIAERVRGRLTASELGEPGRLRAALAETIATLLPVADSREFPEQRQRKLALVGPTGVGKTTTIAKLAAECLMQGKRPALVTVDTYRIAAVEQLKIYGEIMNVPVHVALSPGEFSDALTNCAQADLVLIDTAGRSPRDHAQIEELENFLLSDPEIKNWLVLAAPTRESEMEETVARFRRLHPESLVFTKLDECRQFGSILNLATRCDLPLSYLTDGQRVPEDLRSADASFLADLILNDNGGAPC